MDEFLYSKITVYGFHGCSLETKNKILGGSPFQISANSYDWLGSGVYFWENDYQRAIDWARLQYAEKAAVIGARINLGNCFDISNCYAKKILKISYDDLFQDWINKNTVIPINKPHPNGRGNPMDMVLRYLDRAVIEFALELAQEDRHNFTYDTVRAPFQEGFPVYPGSAFREHDHIHLCVRNPDLLTELFDPESYGKL